MQCSLNACKACIKYSIDGDTDDNQIECAVIFFSFLHLPKAARSLKDVMNVLKSALIKQQNLIAKYIIHSDELKIDPAPNSNI